ncbi:NACHT, LRR and PYD domains-containing protein 12-like isoform X2 [Sphaeramia orbicularis]|uniref:NACHT, LRR and PYD domains-containing protein 12-like isoform X2 n=1 Tax=Sphaeramia orbicularis TaxID=375764 RepID=UPI00117F18B0|nr:NACHT, LRR and PYD domains-containing protein 12-like isoform X2 [Sphaeramia orbicularis]
MTARDLLDILDDLGEEEYERFRWCLLQVQSSKGVIRKGQLEKAKKCETVDLLIQTYELPEAVEVTKQLLKDIPRNDLVQRLSATSPQTKVSLSVGDADVGETVKKRFSELLRPKTPTPSPRPSPKSSAPSSPTSPTALSPTSPTTDSPPISSAVLPSPQLSPDFCETKDLMVPVPEPQSITYYKQMLQSNLHDRFMCAQEGWTDKKDEQCLHDVFMELYVTTGGDVHINSQHEVREIETAENFEGTEKSVNLSNIFTPPSEKYKPIRNLVTSGVAGIGKTFFVHKFILDWTDGKANQDIHLLFPFNFRQLNSLKGLKFSLAELIHECIPESKDITKEALNYIFTTLDASGNTNYDRSGFKLLFVLDGLDECHLNLNLKAMDTLPFDLTKPTKSDVMLRKLINRKLLRSARIWVTTRPAASNQIPRDLIDRMTEVRGFNDQQKEDYFKKRFRDENQARAIFSHIKASRSIHIMCHIPVFCWIIAIVLEDVLKTSKDGELPKTLTEMYTEFLVFQIVHMKGKYGPERCMLYIQALAKLAFEQLEKSKLIFYEKDLKGIGIDVSEVSVYSGVFTEVFKEERGRKKDEVRMFSFVHASVQEFLAAVHVRMSLVLRNKNVMSMRHIRFQFLQQFAKKTSTTKIHKIAIDKTLQSPNGHLDLFLRFLLGLSLQNNNDKLQMLLQKRGSSLQPHQFLLQHLLTDTEDGSETNEETIKYIKKKIGENLSAEKSINLFHCLNELNDRSLVEDIQQYLSSDSLNTDQLTPAQWSALVFILLTSEEDLDVFELKKFSAKEEAFLKLLPVVKASKKALLGCCALAQRSCKALSSVLICQSCSLRELDLSGNELQDSGVKELCSGLESPHCKLENIMLNCCKLSDRSCKVLAGVINSRSSGLRSLDLSYNNLQDSGVKCLSSALKSPKCSLETLSLSGCHLSDRSGEILSSVLSSETSSLLKLSLSNNRLQDSGLKSLLAGLQDPNCILKTLSLSDCLLTREGFTALASALKSNPSNIRELDLSYNHPEQSGIKELSAALENPQCRLDILRLSGCYLSESYCEALSTILSSQSSSLRELDLSYNDLQDSGVKLLSTPLGSPNCKLKILRLCGTNLFRKSCKALSSVLSCHSSSLTEIDLSNNDLQDSGVKLLSEGLRSPHCKLEILRLSGCQITEEGCVAVVSALKSQSRNLREVDLSYNHPGESEVKLLSAIGAPLRMDNGGQQRLTRGLKKYTCELTLDTNTMNKHLEVLDNNKKGDWLECDADPKQGWL